MFRIIFYLIGIIFVTVQYLSWLNQAAATEFTFNLIGINEEKNINFKYEIKNFVSLYGSEILTVRKQERNNRSLSKCGTAKC